MKHNPTHSLNQVSTTTKPGLALVLFASLAFGGLLSTGYGQPTPLFTEDFETGNLSRWTLLTSTALTIQSPTNQVPAAGNYAAFYPSSAARMAAKLPSGL
ncbi:MAG TPA: hypothetical protein VNZ22_10655, partial [Bacillota bacterium]|nr:hypothetical protein [Bacillota bacterium]